MYLPLLKTQIKKRRSIRRFKDVEITDFNKQKITDFCKEISTDVITFTPVFNEPECFGSILKTFGMFKKAKNYVVVKCKLPLLENKLITVGYNGGLLLLHLTSLDYGSCWTVGSFSKSKCKADLKGNEEIVSVICFGVPDEIKSSPRPSKTINEVASFMGEAPEWFTGGTRAALLAPTARNKQSFKIHGSKEGIVITNTKESKNSFISYGIVKRYFELGAYPNEFNYK